MIINKRAIIVIGGDIRMGSFIEARMERERTILARKQIQLSLATLFMLVAIAATMLYSLLLSP